jgi:hypothetical protein
MVPLSYGLTLTEQLLQQLGPSASVVTSADWEVGRLVLAPEFRSDVDALRHCVQLALLHASSSARIDALWATCTHALSRLYRRFGLSPLARDISLPCTKKVYTLIRGTASDVERTLRRPT